MTETKDTTQLETKDKTQLETKDKTEFTSFIGMLYAFQAVVGRETVPYKKKVDK